MYKTKDKGRGGGVRSGTQAHSAPSQKIFDYY